MRLIRTLCLLIAAWPALAQVTFNGPSNSVTATSGSSYSVSRTVAPGGSNLCAFAYVVWGQTTGISVTGVTYGGQAMTAAGPAVESTQTQYYVQIYYLANPPTGSNTLTATFSGTNSGIGLNLVSFSGVNQNTPVRPGSYTSAQGNGTTASITIPSNTADLVTTLIMATNAVTGSSGTVDGAAYGIGDDHSTAGAASVTDTWTDSGSSMWYVLAGLSIEAQPSAPALTFSGCPSSGNYGTASATCTVQSSQNFDGVHSVTLTDSNQIYPGTFRIGANSSSTGSITTIPANGTNSFTVTYTPAAVGARALTTSNTFLSGSSNWTNAAWSFAGTSAQPCTFTMTGSGTQSIAATSGWTSTGGCGHSSPTTGDSLVAAASGGSLTITVPNDGAIHLLGSCPAANTTYDLQLTAAAAGSAAFDVQPGAKFYFCGNKLLASVATPAGSTPTVWADLKYETGATIYEDEAQASYAHRTTTAAANQWARFLWGSPTDTCTFGPGAAYSCPTNVQTINAGSVNPVVYDPNGTTDSHLFKIYGTGVTGGCGSSLAGCITYSTASAGATDNYADAGAIYLNGDVFDTTGTVQAAAWDVNARVQLIGTHFVNDLTGFESLYPPDMNIVKSCAISGSYFSGTVGAGYYMAPCSFVGNVFGNGINIGASALYPLAAFQQNVNIVNPALGEAVWDKAFTAQILNNYWVWTGNTGSNHAFNSGPTNDYYRGNIFETPVAGSGTEGHCSLPGSSAVTVVMLDNLSLPTPSGNNSCQMYGWYAGNSMVEGWFDHNGAYGAGVYSWMLWLGHSTPSPYWPGSGTLIRSQRSNMAWAAGSTGANFAVSNQGVPGSGLPLAPNTNVYVPNQTNNNWYNASVSAAFTSGVNASCSPSTSLGTPYDQCTASGTPGLHDQAVNPRLIDPKRGLFKWASAMQGQTANFAGAAAALLGCQNLAYCINQLEWYVRQGYQPTNLALKGAAHDGGVVGVTGAPGSGYSGPCSATVTVQDSDDLGSGAALACTFVSGVPVVTVTNPGLHYRVANPATVTIAGSGGSGASLHVLASPSDIGPAPITLFAGVAP